MSDLIAGLLRGDHATFQEVWKTCLPLARKLVWQFRYGMDNPDDAAKDLFSGTLMVVFEKIRQPDFELTSSFSTFFFGVARNQLLSRLQKKSHSEITLDGADKYMKETTELPDFDFVESERRLLFWRAIELMDKTCQKILFYFFEKKSMEEIVGLLNLGNAENARRRKFTCKKRLIELVRSFPEFDELKDN